MASTDNNVKALVAEGQSIWLDDISRQMLQSGVLAKQIEEVGIRGVTSNPTIFEKAIAAGTAYDDQVADLIRGGKSAGEIFEAVAVDDIRDACDLFRPLYEGANGTDGFVSIEVSPAFARDAESTLTEARRLWAAIDRPNLMIKIPGTGEGVHAIKTALTEGISVNVTLLFSIASYERVALAFVEALEERLGNGEPIGHVASVASFFVSRVDTIVNKAIDDKLAADGPNDDLAALKGTIAVANAKLAYAKFEEIFGSKRFAQLRSAGAQVQRPLWASTGTKNPEYPDTLYVDSLIGPDTVNTAPGKTIEAFLDHGTVARTVDQNVDEAHAQFAALEKHGIDIDALTRELETQGIASFSKSYDALLEGVESKRQELAAVVAD